MVNQILTAAALLISTLNQPLPASDHPEGFVRKYIEAVKKSSTLVNPIIYNDIWDNESKFLNKNFKAFSIKDYDNVAICPKNIVVTVITLSKNNETLNVCLASNLLNTFKIDCENIQDLSKENTLDSQISICQKVGRL